MSVARAWGWRLEDAAGRDLAGQGAVPPAAAFTRRFDAEHWLGERWRDLARAGVVRAVPLHGGEVGGRPVDLPADRLQPDEL